MGRKLPTVPDFRDLDKCIKVTTTQRDRLMLMLARFAGLRVSEICKLEVHHLDFGRNFMEIRAAKGNKDRILPLPKFLIGPMRGWVGGRTEGYVFPSREGGGRLSNRAVQLLVKRLAKKAGLANWDKPRFFRPHAFRHAFCSSLLAANVPIQAARDLMGHSNIGTTNHYAHSTPELLADAINKAVQ